MALNPQNLKVPTSDEARKYGKKGGEASARSRKAMKTFKQAMIDNLTPQDQKAILDALVRNAKRGNLPSTEFLLKLIGQDPEKDAAVESSITIEIKGADDYSG